MQDILRYLLAWSVVIAHHSHFATITSLAAKPANYSPPYLELLTPLYTKGGYAVFVFFMLSGFMLSAHATRAENHAKFNMKKFLTNRLARIYPAHLITLAAVITLSAVLTAQNQRHFVVYTNDWYHGVLNLVLMHSWGFTIDNSFNAPSWSLSVEFLCYLTLATMLSRSRNQTSILRASFMLAFAGLLLNQISTDPNTSDLGNGILYFYTGVMLGSTTRNKNLSSNRILAVSSVSFIITFYISTLVGLGTQKVIWLLVTIPSLILLITGFDEKYQWLRNRPFKILGLSSFSVYIWHFPIQTLFYTLVGKSGLQQTYNTEQLFWLYIFSTLIVSIISTVTVERKLGRLIRSRAG